jgi:U3 small nucleolar RNA-associated protein 10
VKNLETAVTEVFLKLVMKLNDTTFRPFFITFKDWTFRNAVSDDKLNRQIFFYRFMNKFLATLQVLPVNGFTNSRLL